MGNKFISRSLINSARYPHFIKIYGEAKHITAYEVIQSLEITFKNDQWLIIDSWNGILCLKSPKEVIKYIKKYFKRVYQIDHSINLIGEPPIMPRVGGEM